MIRCIIDIVLSLKESISAKNALQLSRSIDAHAWDDTANHMRQLNGVGNVTVRKFAAAGIVSIEDVANSEDEVSMNNEKVLLEEPLNKKSKRQQREDEFLQASDEEVLGYSGTGVNIVLVPTTVTHWTTEELLADPIKKNSNLGVRSKASSHEKHELIELTGIHSLWQCARSLRSVSACWQFRSI